MKKFTFKFQSLLSLREQLERQKQEVFAKAQRKLRTEEEKLYSLERTKTLVAQKYTSDASSGTKVYKLAELGVFLSHMQKEITWQKETVKKEKENVDKVREELLQAMKDRKILEKLKEKRYDEYLIESKAEEQKVNDQIVSYKVSVGEMHG